MKFLAAVDLSEASMLALDVLSSLPAPEGSEATLLHVVDLDLYTAGGSVPGILRFAEERLHKESERLASCGLHTPAIRVEQGDTTQTIVRVATEENADLIVMTNLGKGARTGRLFGSTAERVASSGVAPVLVERVSVDESDSCCRLSGGSPFERTLVTIDFDHDPEELVEFIRQVPGVEAIKVVHAVPDASEVDGAWQRLSDLVSALPAGIDVESDAVVGPAAEAIVTASAEWAATTIALRPCSHGALRRAVWGSVARQVALKSEHSVLFVPPTS